jgi:hypothetical protein
MYPREVCSTSTCRPTVYVIAYSTYIVMAGYCNFLMSNNTAKPRNNGAVPTIAQIIKAVMSLEAEAKVGALYINCRESIPARHTLKFMGHP